MKNKKIIIFGKDGQLGKEVQEQFLRDKTYNVTSFNKYEVDIKIISQIENVVKDIKPDIIINCAAYTNVDATEINPGLGSLINTHGVANVAKNAFENNAFLIHISTDYVYNGEEQKQPLSHKKNFEEEKPLNNYGLTKLFGEKHIEKIFVDNPNDYLILRTSGIYGRFGQNNLLKKIENLCFSNKKFTPLVINDQKYCPTSALQLARQIKKLSDISKDERRGIISKEGNILNVCSTEWTTPYQFLQKYFILKNNFDFADRLKQISMNDYLNVLKSKNPKNIQTKRPKWVILENEIANRYNEINCMTNQTDAIEEYINITK